MTLRRAAVGLAALALNFAMTSAALAQVKLEYKYPEGMVSTSKSTTKIHQLLTIAGTELETTAEEVVTASSFNGKRAEDGSLPITQKIDVIKSHLELPGGITIDFDTSDPNAKVDLPVIAFLGDVYKALAGASYTVVLDAQDKPKAVEGTEKILEKTKDLDPKVADTLKPRLDAEKVKHAFEQAHGNLPTILVREGEPWEKTEVSDIGGGQTLTFRRQFEYKGTTDRDGRTLDKIAMKALDVVYKLEETPNAPLKAVSSDLKIDSSEGLMLFDRATGTVVERKDVTRIKGDMAFKAGESDLPAKLDLTFDTLVTRETGKKE